MEYEYAYTAYITVYSLKWQTVLLQTTMKHGEN